MDKSDKPEAILIVNAWLWFNAIPVNEQLNDWPHEIFSLERAMLMVKL